MQEFKSANQRWMDRVAAPPIPVTQSVFPEDATAIIYKLARSPMRSAGPRPQWKLRFEPRAPRVTEPLMGWTAAQDTLPQVELSFPSAEAAVAYARRHGLRYVLHSDGDIDATVHRLQDAKRAAAAKPQPGSRPWRLEWIERTLGADVVHNAIRSQPDQSFARYASPQDVMGDPTLSEAEKRDVLRRWALDAYLIECSLSRGETVPHPSRLDEVVDALIDLDEVNRQLISTHLSKAASQQNAA
jgi:hypothetical protein